MPKNMGKGGKNRKRGTNKNEPQKRELVVKEEGQEYAQVLKNLGGNRLELHCVDGTKRMGVIRGAIRRKMWICVGDIVLVGLRDFEEGKVDVLSRYTPDETKQLIKERHIPPHMQTEEQTERTGGNIDFVQMDSDEEAELFGNLNQPANELYGDDDDEDEEDEEDEDGAVDIDNI